MKLSWLKLAYIAAKCVIQTMREGDKKYKDDRWLRQTLDVHAGHAREHAHNYISYVIYGDRSRCEDDIAHMITRGAMIKYLEGDK